MNENLLAQSYIQSYNQMSLHKHKYSQAQADTRQTLS